MIKRQFTKQLDNCKSKQNNKQYVRNFIGVFVFALSFLTSSYSQNIGINTTGATPNSKALLDVDADNVTGEKKGLLIPRMTTTERNAISSPVPESLLIYNTTTQCFEAWNQSIGGWVVFGSVICQLPDIFNASSASMIAHSSFVANWSPSAGATGYSLDVSYNSTFTSFVAGFNNLSVSNVVTYSVTGLTASTTYYYRVRAINACGTTTYSNTITQTTSAAALSAGCNTAQVEADYGTVVSTLTDASLTWITRNLGAPAIASSGTSTANNEAGCYFQFNRAQAYGHDNGGSVNPSWTITSIRESGDWLVGNDPCRLQLGGSWRLPTAIEWMRTDCTGGTSCTNLWWSITDIYASVFKIHAAGFLDFTTGALADRGNRGYYWSSTRNSADFGWILFLDSFDCAVDYYFKSYGFPVRCLK